MKIHSLFTSIDGEVNQYGQGIISTFLRLSGCNLQCSYCDIPEAREEFYELEVSELAKQIMEIGCKKITITGGEPLLQARDIRRLIYVLNDESFNPYITIETNGTQEPFKILPKVDYISFVVDFKLPSAKLEKVNVIDFYKVYGELREIDWIKFVISDDKDYEVARKAVRHLFSYIPVRKAFGPVHGVYDPVYLMGRMIEDELWEVSLNLQLHKYIGVA